MILFIFYFFKICYVKKKKKSTSTFNENIDQFFIWKKKNANLHLMKMQIHFLFKKNSDLHLRKMQIRFWFKKNSDLHLMKMQIHFYLKKKKRIDFETKTEIITIIKRIKNMFQQNKSTIHDMNTWNNYTKINKLASSQQEQY